MDREYTYENDWIELTIKVIALDTPNGEGAAPASGPALRRTEGAAPASGPALRRTEGAAVEKLAVP